MRFQFQLKLCFNLHIIKALGVKLRGAMWLRVCRKKTKTTAKKENKQTKKKERKKETKINYKNAQQKLAKALYI